jgi:hypothetical protein
MAKQTYYFLKNFLYTKFYILIGKTLNAVLEVVVVNS